MEYQKIINLLDNIPNHWQKKWVEINDLWGTYSINSPIRFRKLMLKSSDTYIVFKGTVTVPDISAAADATNNANKKVIIKICAPFSKCISKIIEK